VKIWAKKAITSFLDEIIALKLLFFLGIFWGVFSPFFWSILKPLFGGYFEVKNR
jgi:hypothetical protein